ncbi:hypothetical protein FKZ61_007175 [Litorilinea aerophila]|uniref:FecR domain-containing protein n=1 Tax=Litorilinea aerophila TaxID=1204385 RepID=A0A540VIR2_9CHLR|nr:hypothetical protein [Litorilinea aerophila]MCC9075888.1 hypothetical protein [Litorilinea aerophila]OUC06186.1 hypothetical protein RY27_22605 [Litorilinea aerophila]GIV77181.1 MAG: hypothetical protein KatS3mg050_1575 [Litorilinea sp.]
MNSQFSRGLATESITPNGAWETQSVPRWRENPERLAWLVLLISFAIFVMLVILVPLSIRYVVRYATVSQDARLEPILGTLLVYPSATSSEPIAITGVRNDIKEGSRIVATDDSTQGTLGLITQKGSDEVLGSMQIYPNTVVDVLRIRRPFFERSPEPYQVRLALQQGQARIFTNTGSDRGLHVELQTPHGQVSFGAGSYQVSVDENQTDIIVRSGQATVIHGQNEEIVVDAGRRVWMTRDDFSHNPVSAEQNLIRNGDFSEPMFDTWQSRVEAENTTPGSINIVEREGRRIAHFIRMGEENVHTEVRLTQEVNKDVNVYDYMSLQLDVKLLFQSLAGAGYLSTEFPLRVELEYTDIYGKVERWGHGFYFRDPKEDDDPSNDNWPIRGGERIPGFKWYTYQSPNLIELLAAQGTRPARVNKLHIYASGHNYQSMVSEIYLIVR